MLVITRPADRPATAAASFDLDMAPVQRRLKERAALVAPAPAPVPPTPACPAVVVPFGLWASRHEYFIDCMAAYLRRRLEGRAAAAPLSWDWPGMRDSLARFLHRTSANRYRGFTLHH